VADGRKLTICCSEWKESSKTKLPGGIIGKCNEKGWAMEELMVEWLREVWHVRLGALIKKRVMLVSDAFKGNLTEKVKIVTSNLLNMDLVIIPFIGSSCYLTNH
jgi:hypothetical protein